MPEHDFHDDLPAEEYVRAGISLMDELEAEAQRQDKKHGRFTAATALGASRLAIACLEDEIAEVKEAWRLERRAEGWQRTEEELLQVAAVAMRAVRDLRAGRDTGNGGTP